MNKPKTKHLTGQEAKVTYIGFVQKPRKQEENEIKYLRCYKTHTDPAVLYLVKLFFESKGEILLQITKIEGFYQQLVCLERNVNRNFSVRRKIM